MKLPSTLVREIQDDAKAEVVTIHPGDFYVTQKKGIVIHTLLGSCVAACLYDPISKVIGMNHFLLSNKRYAKGMPICISEAGRYGVHAMELLINGMLKIGALKKNLKAKVFGGAKVFETERQSNFICVGDVNVRFIREFLSNEKIPLMSSDLGGDRGSVIYFSSSDYSVYLRKIKKSATSRVEVIEEKYWEKKISKQEKAEEENAGVKDVLL
ncbi:MAG: chemotaxis protein CheD [Spirochaetes bacterium]|nr:chemotaxis protein CheD [Spirochaetota bacterium]